MSLLTGDIPGTGGHYKETPEDFMVEEIPLYPCCGEGEHLYLWIEKRGISTRELVHQLTKALNLHERELGYAGLKDSRALTRQMISIPAAREDLLNGLHHRDWRILSTARHTNKLRLGHLAGNRFTITLRDVCPAATERVDAVFHQLQQIGVPNRFGEQRYGVLGNSAQLGSLLLQQRYEEFCREMIGDPQKITHRGWQQAAQLYRAGDLQAACATLPPRMRDEQQLLRRLIKGDSHATAVRGLSRNLLRLYLSATQSSLFDQLLNARLHGINQLQDGDIAIKHSNGACFRVDKADQEQQRADAFEISPTAPLFGSKIMLANGLPGTHERQLLNALNLQPQSWSLNKLVKMPGERRALRIKLEGAQILKNQSDLLVLSFILPKGSYATAVLREIIK